MLNKKILSIGLLISALLLGGCQNRTEKTAHFQDNIVMDTSTTIKLPYTVKYAEKRGFNDFDGDGIQDMIEISDEAFFGQEYKMRFFKGYINNGLLNYSKNVEIINIPIKKNWGSANTKVDTADVNGDGLADIIFSQYKEGHMSDDLVLSVSLNKGTKKIINGKEKFQIKFDESYMDFKYEEKSFVSFLGMLIQQQDISYGEDESLYDYLKMDWADMDGDGLDDLVLLWRDGRHGYDLSVDIFFNKKTTRGLSFKGNAEMSINSILYQRSIRNVDMEDYDGNGLSDILVYQRRGDTLIATVALNTGIRLIANKDVILNLPETLDTFASARKLDTFDMNNDGKADINYITEEDDKAVVVTFGSKIEKVKREN